MAVIAVVIIVVVPAVIAGQTNVSAGAGSKAVGRSVGAVMVLAAVWLVSADVAVVLSPVSGVSGIQPETCRCYTARRTGLI